jgi:hypothetical protein
LKFSKGGNGKFHVHPDVFFHIKGIIHHKFVFRKGKRGKNSPSGFEDFAICSSMHETGWSVRRLEIA